MIFQQDHCSVFCACLASLVIGLLSRVFHAIDSQLKLLLLFFPAFFSWVLFPLSYFSSNKARLTRNKGIEDSAQAWRPKRML